MTFLLKLAALVFVVVMLAPIIGANTQFGQVIGSAVDDVSTFCDRRPVTCEQGGDLARATARLVASTVDRLIASAESPSLTPDDRALTPTPAAEHNAIAANNGPSPLDNRPVQGDAKP
ncbi:hypothetical protein [Acuticoccus mangrovi]|uniref:Uncharacterized protein n=1 Tax=Acuticoccus mangrovi TaxID=2796142 RepID=A0A934IM14_9HYPH|nr:hypothetical protein [Acuticoccus mangrovi]MBJ3774833.1 hypothetical protein [Acuticoccus mangrovi]